MAAKKATSNSETGGEPTGGLFFAEEQQLSQEDILFPEAELALKMWTELLVTGGTQIPVYSLHCTESGTQVLAGLVAFCL